MAIVKMSRLRLLGLKEQREQLLKKLQRLGCVQLECPDMTENPEQWQSIAARDEADDSGVRAFRARLASALSVLDQYAPGGGGLFAERPELSESSFYDSEDAEAAAVAARLVLEGEQRIKDAETSVQALKVKRRALEPWLKLDVPLEARSTAHVKLRFVTMPVTVNLNTVMDELDEAGCDYSLLETGRDSELVYLRLLCYAADYEDARIVLRRNGINSIRLPEMSGWVPDAVSRVEKELAEAEEEKRNAVQGVKDLSETRAALQLSMDKLDLRLDRERTRSELLLTQSAFYTEGWLPTEDVPRLAGLLAEYDAVWETEEVPFEESTEVPVKLKNNRLTRGMNMVTNMYSLPAYGTIDPNPLMAPFFIVFYGLMMADMAYGILMLAAGIFVLKKMKPRESMRNFAELLTLCGISTFVFGAMTGGFFGDFIPCIAKLINPNTTFTAMPSLFTPLSDTISILLGSLVLGVIQIIVGMTVSIVYKAKHGDFIDALFDEITWWIILAGVALAVLKIGNVRGIPVVLIVGCLMLVLGGTRNAKGFGKVTSLIGLVYNGVTGYFSDILSYARIMALMLAGSVIASVFNTLGTVTGNVVLFIIISLIGNALNMALNLLGCYVHDLRLQCLEFFNRFYHEGGRAFTPLKANTKYVDIINDSKEEI